MARPRKKSQGKPNQKARQRGFFAALSSQAPKLFLVIFLVGTLVGTFAIFFAKDVQSVKVSYHGFEIVRGFRSDFGDHMIQVKPHKKDSAELRPQPQSQPPATSPLPKVVLKSKKKYDFGYYIEHRKAQGDAFEDETYSIRVLCIPPFRMPLVCYLNQQTRKTIPIPSDK